MACAQLIPNQRIRERYDRICSSLVPIIVYSGPNELLSDIFNRINVQGEPLNDYEIYAAVWGQEKRKVNNDHVVNKVVAKYLMLLKEGFTIDGFDSNKMFVEKELTAFEFLFGLGKYWNDKYECLRFGSTGDLNKVSEISFEIIDACLNDSRNISNLHNKLFKYDINKLQRRIEEAISFVEDSIAVVSKFKGNKRKSYLLHSKYQIISLVAFAFRQMYDPNDLSQKLKNWENNEKKIRKLILSHYVADIILNEWREGGNSKLYSFLREERYMHDISRQRWNSILDNYYQSQLANKQAERFSYPTNGDSVILNCIYLKLFSADDQLSNKRFDIEHLATKEKMRKIIRNYSGCKLPVSCIANYCYLPEDINRGKKEKIIYEAKNLSIPIEEIENKYSFTTAKDFNWIFLDYKNISQEVFENNYYKYLEDRYLVIKEKFLKAIE